MRFVASLSKTQYLSKLLKEVNIGFLFEANLLMYPFIIREKTVLSFRTID